MTTPTTAPAAPAKTKLTIEDAAKLCHKVNKIYCSILGDDSQPNWGGAPDWQRNSAINGVKAFLANPQITPEQSHQSWLAQKQAEGWVFGKVKDPEKKTHPCMKPYAELPQEQKIKDALFTGVLRAIAPVIEVPQKEEPKQESTATEAAPAPAET